jgi:hypothetical protein
MKIFFSWQADLPQAASTRIIRRCLQDAANELAHDRELRIAVEEATTGNSGSPYIPGALAEKIRKCDIFVGDVTTVARVVDPSDVLRVGKSLPNPNVTFELGLAAAHVGWDRIIMLFNTALAEFEQLPFDFDRHRMTKFSIAADQAKEKGKMKELAKELRNGLAAIIDGAPQRPRDLEGKSQDEIRHARDVAKIKALFRNLSINFLDTHLKNMPEVRHYSAAWMFDGASAVVGHAGFDLHDTELRTTLRTMVTELGNTLAYDGLYGEMNRGHVQSFGLKNAFTDPVKEQAAARDLAGAVSRLQGHLKKALRMIRDRYLEIDLEVLSRELEDEFHAAMPAD